MPDVSQDQSALRLIQELPRQIERMHRRFLDVVRLEMWRLGIRDLSPVQIMMLSNIGQGDVPVRDLIERGYYLGSNASYNLKHLVDGGYVERKVSQRDRRSAQLRVTPKGMDVLIKLNELEERLAKPILEGGDSRAIGQTHETLHRLERSWSDALRAAPPAPAQEEEPI